MVCGYCLADSAVSADIDVGVALAFFGYERGVGLRAFLDSADLVASATYFAKAWAL